MNLKNKNLLALLAAGLSLSVISCEKEEPALTPDTENPTISLSHSGQANDLFGEITLTATAQDNEGIERIDFFLNGTSLGQAIKEPFEILWNSDGANDGQHILKAVAYDAANNKNEATQAITIKNTLFTASIADGYTESHKNRNGYTHYDSWLYLTDENGNTIGEAQQISGGQELKWSRTAEFPTGTFYLNRMEYYNTTLENSNQNKGYILYTYPDFTLEKAEFKSAVPFKVPTVGKVDVTINNGFDGSATYEYGSAFHRYIRTYLSSANLVNFKSDLSREREFGLTTYASTTLTHENRVKFYKWDEFQTGGTYNFHTNEFKPMDAHTVTFPQELNLQYFGTIGYLNAEKTEAYNIDGIYLAGNMPANSKATIFYADQVFPYVSTFITGTVANKYFYHYMNKKAPTQITVPTFYLEVIKPNPDNFQVNLQGEFDYGHVNFGYSSFSETESVNVKKVIYTGNTPRQYAFSKIPVNLLKLYPQFDNTHTFKYISGSATDYVGSVSYEQLLESLFTSSYDGPAMDEFTYLTTYPQNEGGRIYQAPADPNVRMEEEIMKARGFFPY